MSKSIKSTSIPASRIKTLKELGFTLPVGSVGSGGSIKRTFSLYDFKLVHDSTWKKKCGLDSTTGEEITYALAIALKRWGDNIWKEEWPGSDDWETEFIDKCRVIRSSPSADVLYAYFYLRYFTMGRTFEIRLPCDGVNHRQASLNVGNDPLELVEIKLDLETLDVATVPDDSLSRRGEIILPHITTIRNKKIKSLIMGSAYWSAIERVLSLENNYNSDCLVLQSSILSIVDENGNKEDVTLDEIEVGRVFSLRNKKALMSHVDELSGGPKIMLEAYCPICRNPMSITFDYRYVNFFG